MADRHAIGRSAHRSGGGFEHEVSKNFSEWYGKDDSFYRTPGSGSHHWAESMNVMGDVVSDPTIGFKYLIECKRYNGWTIENLLRGNNHFPSWFAQAVREGEDNNKVPLLVYKRPRSDTFVTMPYEPYLAKKLDPIIVQNLSFSADHLAKEKHTPTKAKIMTTTLPEFLKNNFDYLQNKCYKSDWKKQVVYKVNKEAVKESPESLVDKEMNKIG